MKQKEKTALTKERILRAAVLEFGTNGYANTSINTICSNHKISKGLLYHNFSGKDELYLACVSRCFCDITEYLKKTYIQNDLKKYMSIRMDYFSKHKYYAVIFFEAILQTPSVLSSQISALRKDFDLFNRKIYQKALSEMILRDGITQADAITYYEILYNMFNGYFSSTAYAKKDFQFIINEHEKLLSKMMDFMLFGIAERKK